MNGLTSFGYIVALVKFEFLIGYLLKNQAQLRVFIPFYLG